MFASITHGFYDVRTQLTAVLSVEPHFLGKAFVTVKFFAIMFSTYHFICALGHVEYRSLMEDSFTDDTYMYDDEARGLSGRGHWYDEPPYESDPEDFLMGGGAPAATFQNGRVCFTLNLRNEARGEGVISLRSAGDISLARAPRRGLIIPQSGPYPTTVIPLRSARDRESGDYAASDIQSIGSRLSGISLESSRSERDSRRGYRQMSGYRIGADPLSPASSDYEDQESETDSQHIATVHKVIYTNI